MGRPAPPLYEPEDEPRRHYFQNLVLTVTP